MNITQDLIKVYNTLVQLDQGCPTILHFDGKDLWAIQYNTKLQITPLLRYCYHRNFKKGILSVYDYTQFMQTLGAIIQDVNIVNGDYLISPTQHGFKIIIPFLTDLVDQYECNWCTTRSNLIGKILLRTYSDKSKLMLHLWKTIK